MGLFSRRWTITAALPHSGPFSSEDWAEGSPPHKVTTLSTAVTAKRPTWSSDLNPISSGETWTWSTFSTWAFRLAKSQWQPQQRFIGETLKQQQSNNINPVWKEFKQTRSQRQRQNLHKEDGTRKIGECLEEVTCGLPCLQSWTIPTTTFASQLNSTLNLWDTGKTLKCHRDLFLTSGVLTSIQNCW